MAERITALFVKHIKRPGKYADGGNLYLQVRPSTRIIETNSVTKSWIFRYSRFGKDTWLGLGPYPDVTLADARDLATRERKKMRQGIDPLTDKRARQIAARTAHDGLRRQALRLGQPRFAFGACPPCVVRGPTASPCTARESVP